MTKSFLKKFIPHSLIDWYHFFMSLSGAIFYGFPSRQLKVIGVTGTKGKSTVVYMIAKILEEAGFKVAAFSSLSFKIGQKEEQNKLKMTMPGRWQLQRMLRQAVRAGCEYVVIEVTSEGIKQHRHRFIKFEVAVFTNLAPEHIEAHGSFEKYRQAKGKLFKATRRTHVINLDDDNAEYFLKFLAETKIGFTVVDGFPSHIMQKIHDRRNFVNKEIAAENVVVSKTGSKFKVYGLEFTVNLLGAFNIYNALAAICVVLSQGIDLTIAQKALVKIKSIPGRMEVVIDQPFQVMVDYAHTPDSLEAVYKTLQANNRKPKTHNLICVFGSAGGGRDKWKRPVMGKIAAQYCDQIILTNEDPYDENPSEIIEQIKQGISINQPNQYQSAVFTILDRGLAIRKALQLAHCNDIIIITGKGSEPWIMGSGGLKISWDDRQVVREEYKNLSV